VYLNLGPPLGLGVGLYMIAIGLDLLLAATLAVAAFAARTTPPGVFEGVAAGASGILAAIYLVVSFRGLLGSDFFVGGLAHLPAAAAVLILLVRAYRLRFEGAGR